MILNFYFIASFNLFRITFRFFREVVRLRSYYASSSPFITAMNCDSLPIISLTIAA